jgi:transmembrane sensor
MSNDAESSEWVRRQAAKWWTLLREDEVSAAEREQFIGWLMCSPECVAAYLDIERLVRALRTHKLRWPDTSAEQLILDANAAPPVPTELPRSGSLVRRLSRRWRSPALRWSAAAGVTLLLGIGVLGSLWPHRYETSFGERRSILLSDGSRVTLDSASSISVEFSRHHRDVRLLAGEAMFQVNHDENRPFDVSSGHAVIRAIGTEFNVDSTRSMTVVTVLKGRVAVIAGSGAGNQAETQPAGRVAQIVAQIGGAAGQDAFRAPAAALILSAAERVVITSEGARRPEHVPDAASATSWIQQRFVFDHLPLSEVTEELNRYTRERIRIDSPELQRREVSGVIELDNPEAVLSFLSSVPDTTILEAADGTRVVGLRGLTTDPAR